MVRSKKFHDVLLILIFGGSLCYHPSAKAADDEWRFQLTPYIWATSADIDAATINGRSASAELDFNDLFDLLDFAGFARIEARKGRLGFFFDATYADLGAEGDFKPQIGPITFPTIEIESDFRQASLDLGVTYRFYIPSGEKKKRLWIEPLGGLRYAYLKQEIDISKAPGPVIGALGRTLGDEEEWFEPFIGARIGVNLTPKLTFIARGDIGGFGLDDASDLTWNFLAGFDYKPWQSVSIKIGYRIYDIDYEKGDGNDEFGLDAQLHGPAAGVTFYF
jgi:hypothetical protein